MNNVVRYFCDLFFELCFNYLTTLTDDAVLKKNLPHKNGKK